MKSWSGGVVILSLYLSINLKKWRLSEFERMGFELFIFARMVSLLLNGVLSSIILKTPLHHVY